MDKQTAKNMMAIPTRDSRTKDKLSKSLKERVSRQMEALRLYRCLPTQRPFHDSAASERIVRGGNRSGKSTSAAVEFASAVTGIPIHDQHGNPIPFRYPTNRPLLTWVIGYDQRHVGGTIYRLLFRPGVFKVIRDKETELFRAWNPTDPEDLERQDEVRPSPPLIPFRLIDPNGWAWENKAERVFTVCRLKNGTEIHAFSSKGEPKQGDPVDLIWVDEDIAFPKHVSEWQARLSDTKGRMIWSAFPHSKNDALIDMSKRASQQIDRDKPDVKEVILTYSSNPFIDQDEKRKRLEGWSEEERRARDRGEFLSDTIAVYPNFSESLHGIAKGDENVSKVHKAILSNGLQPPSDWTRYLVLDPGHAKPAVLFAAVPPPERFGDYIVVYDEIAVPRIDAEAMAKLVQEKVAGHRFEAFVIDYRAGRQTPGGFGKTVQKQYAEAFAKEGVASAKTGSSFAWGDDNIEAGILSVRSALTVRPDGTTKLKYVVDNCPNFARQMEQYKKHITHSQVEDKPAAGQKDDLCDCMRYMIRYRPEYVLPRNAQEAPRGAYLAFQQWSEKQRKEQQDRPIMMGPQH